MNQIVFEGVKKIVADSLDVSESEITIEKTFSELGGDSLDAVDTIMRIEKEFDIAISDRDMEKLTTVGAIVNYIESRSK